MKIINMKTKDGFESLFYNDGDYLKFLKENTNEKGEPQREIILFKDFFVKAADDKIEFRLSDMGLDRDRERIDPAGWDIQNYLDNPIILWSHNKLAPSVGIMDNIRVENGELLGEAKFIPKDIDLWAWGIGERVRQGFLKKGSVGFIPKLMEFVDNDETEKEETVLVHRSQELLEYSIVNVPALPSSGVKTPSFGEDFNRMLWGRETSGENTLDALFQGEKHGD